MRASKCRDLLWILVILLSVFAVAPLSYPGFFQAQSGFLPAFNAEHLSSAPYWGRVADPVRGEGKLPYLLAWPFLQLSGSGVAAVKWGYALAFVLGALGTYAWTRHWLGAQGAVLASVVYTYLPWHLSTVYVRGAFAEAWLWACWPYCLWAIDRWIESRALWGAVVGLCALAATFWIQPGLFALSIPLLAAYYALAEFRRPRPLARLAGALALSFLLLWIAGRIAPAPRQPFAGFIYPFQLISAAWGDELSFQLGLAAVGLSIVALALWAGKRSGENAAPPGPGSPALDTVDPPVSTSMHLPFSRALWFWFIALLLLILLVLPFSAFLWRATGYETLLTYPWQLLALAGMPLAFLAGSAIRLDDRLVALPAWAGLIAFVVLASYPYLSPSFTQVDPGPEPVAMFLALEPDVPPAGTLGPAALRGHPQLMLLDYQVAPPTEITPTLTLTLTWQTVEPVVEDYTVFVHVLGQGDAKAAQRDTRPCEGECPTNGWQPGAIVVDRYQLDLAPDAPPGPYRLAVGLYLLESGQRALLVGRDDGTVYLDVP